MGQTGGQFADGGQFLHLLDLPFHALHFGDVGKKDHPALIVGQFGHLESENQAQPRADDHAAAQTGQIALLPERQKFREIGLESRPDHLVAVMAWQPVESALVDGGDFSVMRDNQQARIDPVEHAVLDVLGFAQGVFLLDDSVQEPVFRSPAQLDQRADQNQCQGQQAVVDGKIGAADVDLSPIVRIIELKTRYDEKKNPDKKGRKNDCFETDYSSIKKETEYIKEQERTKRTSCQYNPPSC